MIKCVDKGIWTCIGRNGVPKKSYLDDKSAISADKIVNEKDPKQNTKTRKKYNSPITSILAFS